MREGIWERRAAILFCAGVGVLLGYFFFRYLLGILLPFLIAWLLSLLIARLAKPISTRLRLPQKLCAALLLVLFLGAAVALICFSVNALMRELREMLAGLIENGGIPRFLQEPFDLFSFVMQRLGVSEGKSEAYAAFRAHFEQMVSSFGKDLLLELSEAIPTLAARIVSALPSFLFVILITVIAGFYFCMEPGLMQKMLLLLPRRVREWLNTGRERAGGIWKSYLRAYLLLLLLTFLELLVGFWILGVDYAFLSALLIALLDLLPVLGVGTVLLPWATVAFFQKNLYLGFGLLILYFAVFVLRQIMEPRLIGRSLGLHPLLALFAGYAGWRFFGFLGMALGPLAALLIKTFFFASGEKTR